MFFTQILNCRIRGRVMYCRRQRYPQLLFLSVIKLRIILAYNNSYVNKKCIIKNEFQPDFGLKNPSYLKIRLN